MPAYVAWERGYFREQGIAIQPELEATAWLVPERLLSGEVLFGLIPWTRVVAASVRGEPLVLVCGSGCEEAAIVVRHGLATGAVRKVAIPQRGGMKDLTAAASFAGLGWKDVECLRLPSGDAAILCLIGGGADAASMVEPYATLIEQLGLGAVVRRTGDLWSGAPGCSLTTTASVIERDPDLVRRVVAAFICGARDVESDPEGSAEIASRYIGVAAGVIRRALRQNWPNVHALENEAAMSQVVSLMVHLGYLPGLPSRPYKDLSFLRDP